VSAQHEGAPSGAPASPELDRLEEDERAAFAECQGRMKWENTSMVRKERVEERCDGRRTSVEPAKSGRATGGVGCREAKARTSSGPRANRGAQLEGSGVLGRSSVSGRTVA
jgi:hypothetical protein